MHPERWRQIEELYHDALELAPEYRLAFLDRVCAGDDELRREVESLLASHEQAESFIEAPPGDVAAAFFAGDQTPGLIGRTLSHYRIRASIGAGGMGEVYLAEDMLLGRKVALKLLPKEFTRDRERVRRFRQEARAASSLNHPNILTIFEIGQVGDLHFIATEFIEGQTVRERLRNGQLQLRDAVEIAAQVASALSAAHEAGIVHRDIKPENIMLRRDGYVKVLDFGLAKLIEPFRAEATTITGSGTSAAGQISTDPGKVVGTPRYMSPEQIRGQQVDARADIFSLGVTLYEMIAGRPPFEGATQSEMVAAILHVEPIPLARLSPGAPTELERIVRKALRKEREERYQVVKDLQLDLKNFKEEMEFQVRLASARRSAAGDEAMIEASGRRAGIGRYRRSAALALAALAVTLAILALAWFPWRGERRQDAPFRIDKITRLTTAGKAGRVAISPDGKEVVYSLVDAGQESLWLKQVETGSEIRIVPPERVKYHSITFSRNGAFIYYVRRERNEAIGVLYHATKLGGAARKLLSNVDSPIALSPDGKQFAFVRRNSSAGGYLLVVANEDGSEKIVAVSKRHPIIRTNGPSWSPDGKLIACAVENLSGNTSLAVVRVADGEEETINSQSLENVGQVAWLADGAGLLVVATEPRGRLTQVWSLAWPSGETRKITHDLSNYYNLSLTADSATLATVRTDGFVNIWVVPEGDASRAVQITTGAQRDDGVRGLVWTPDGRIVYRSFAGGNYNVWIMEADGSGSRRLSTDAHQSLDPTVSPDGSFIAWSFARAGPRNIWRMDPDGSNLKQLTGGAGEWFPQFTPDGKWLIYQALDPVKERLLQKMPLDGGPPVQLTEQPSYAPVISPDGKLIACNYRPEPGSPIGMAVISIEGGPPLKTFDLPGEFDRPIRWTPDGRALAYIDTRDGVSNIWAQPLLGGRPKPLTDFKTQRIFNFAWSRDGRRLAISRGESVNDVALISALR
jgi:Tol biopolymer transport system component/tRNA A-37 threonylcarbamoyl transferase component Bud32